MRTILCSLLVFFIFAFFDVTYGNEWTFRKDDYLMPTIDFKKKLECKTDAYPPENSTELAWYDVNLDEDPKTRWRNVVSGAGDQIRALLTQFKYFISNLTQSDILIKLIDKEFVPLAHTLPQPYQDELIGIANLTGIPLGEITLYNIFYEVFPACTSILAEDPKGTLYHARNMDFGLFLGWDVANNTWKMTEYLRRALVNVRFSKGGKVLFKTSHYAGYIGIVTGLKQKAFTLTVNSRVGHKHGDFIAVLEWIMGKRDTAWLGILTRETFEQATTYSEALDKLSNTKIFAPIYFILGGNTSMEGCVITRNRTHAVDIWHRQDAKNHTWFLLQTNYDHWKPPFFLDDRRTPGTKCMMQKTQAQVRFNSLFNVLSSKPVLNKLTTYSALMQVENGDMHSYRRYCKDPCPLF